MRAVGSADTPPPLRRREKSALLHRVVGTPAVVRDKDEDLVTYSFRAEPAGFHEMFDDLELSYFHGHYTEVQTLAWFTTRDF